MCCYFVEVERDVAYEPIAYFRTQLGRIEQPDWSVGGNKQNHLVIYLK